MGRVPHHRRKAFRGQRYRQGIGRVFQGQDFSSPTSLLLTSAVSHLVEIAMPEEEVKRGKWTGLRICRRFLRVRFAPDRKTADRLKAVVKLISARM